MEHRRPLSDEVAISLSLDDGLRALAGSETPTWAADLPDVKALSQQPNGREAIQALPPQIVYLAIKELGLSEARDILPLLSQEQFTRCLDYDTWQDESLDQSRLMEWIRAYGEIKPEAMAVRFINLEEEYQLAALDKLIRTYDLETYEAMPQDMQDQLYPLPCNELFYEILSDDAALHETIQRLITASIGVDLAYTYSLLAHAAYLPPHEAENTLHQFRTARMEEDGFVSLTEAQGLFVPLDLKTLKDRLSPSLKRAGASGSSALAPAPKPGIFWNEVLRSLDQEALDLDPEDLRLAFVRLVNGLASATRLQSFDLRRLRLMMTRATEIVSVGLEYLSDGDCQQAAQILAKEHLQVIFRVGLSLVDALREDVLDALASWQPGLARRLRAAIRGCKWGHALRLIDQELRQTLGHLAAEGMMGLFNRFPMVPSAASNDQEDQKSLYMQQLAPVASMAQLAEIGHHAAAVAALVRFYGSLETQLGTNAELVLDTALVRYAWDGEPSLRPLTLDEVQRLNHSLAPRLKTARQDLVGRILGKANAAAAADSAATSPFGLIGGYLRDATDGFMVALKEGADARLLVIQA